MNGGSTKPVEVSRRKDAEIELRREACIDAAERLFVAKGLDATSMQDIAAEVGVSVGTLYNMFESKMELAHQMFLRRSKAEEEWAESITNDTGISAREALTRFVAKAIERVREHQVTIRVSILTLSPPLWRHKETLEDVVRHRDKMLGCLSRLVERGIREGLIRNDVEPGRIAAGMVGAMMGLFMYMVQHEGTIPDNLTAERICELLLSGVGRRAQDG